MCLLCVVVRRPGVCECLLNCRWCFGSYCSRRCDCEGTDSGQTPSHTYMISSELLEYLLSLITAACASIGHGPIKSYTALIHNADADVVIVCDHDLGSAPPSEPCCPVPETDTAPSSRLLADRAYLKPSSRRTRGEETRFAHASITPACCSSYSRRRTWS